MYSDNFMVAYKAVGLWEGGLVDDPHDRGGITKWGISLRALLAKALDLNGDGAVNRRDILDMSEGQAEQIYWEDYWLASSCNWLPTGLSLMHYDCAVNQGPGRAARILQASLRVKVDGQIGPITLKAAELAPPAIVSEYAARRAVHYSSLSQVTRYGLGWFRRLFSIHASALKEMEP